MREAQRKYVDEAMKDANFMRFYTAQVEPIIDELLALRHEGMVGDKNAATLAWEFHVSDLKQEGVENHYLHKLIALVNVYFNKEEVSNIKFDSKEFFDTALIDSRYDLLLGENLSGSHGPVHYDIVYGMLSATGYSVSGIDVAKNFYDHVILHRLTLPESLGNIILAWHKDFLLDLAETREKLGLRRVMVGDSETHRLFKIYSRDEEMARRYVSHGFVDALFHIMQLCGERPLDFSFEENQLSVITREIHNPFALTKCSKDDGEGQVKEDLMLLKQQVELTHHLIDALNL